MTRLHGLPSTAASRALALLAAGALVATAGASSAADERSRWLPTAPTGVPVAHEAQLAAFPDGTAFALAGGQQAQADEDDSAGIGILRSDNGGLTWDAPLTQPAFAGLPVLAMADSRRGFFASGRLVSRTDDAASTWRVLTVPFLTKSMSDGVDAASALTGGQHALLVKSGFEFREDGCPVQLTNTPVQVTADGGRTWRPAPMPFTSQAVDAQHATAQRVLVRTFPYERQEPVIDEAEGDCSVGGGVLRTVRHVVTDDAGRSWRSVLDCAAPCVATWADSQTLVVVRADGSTLVSSDAGRTLRAAGSLAGANAADQKYVHAVDFLNPKIGYASVYNAGTYRTADGGKTWALERAEPEATQFGTFADAVAIDATRAVAVSTTGFFARIADPLPGPAMVNESPLVGAPTPIAGLQLDGRMVLPTHQGL